MREASPYIRKIIISTNSRIHNRASLVQANLPQLIKITESSIIPRLSSSPPPASTNDWVKFFMQNAGDGLSHFKKVDGQTAIAFDKDNPSSQAPVKSLVRYFVSSPEFKQVLAEHIHKK
ncbi:Uncharacterised protein [uncultured archaeon]|nr:Uncharacterised protein [uncultured archaeon]